MTAYGAILASGRRKVIVIVPPSDRYAGLLNETAEGVGLDLATGELVPLASREGTTWHALTGFTTTGGGAVAVAPGDSVVWSLK